VRSTDEPAVDRSLRRHRRAPRRWLSGLSNNRSSNRFAPRLSQASWLLPPAVSNYRMYSAGRFLSLHGAGPRSHILNGAIDLARTRIALESRG